MTQTASQSGAAFAVIVGAPGRGPSIRLPRPFVLSGLAVAALFVLICGAETFRWGGNSATTLWADLGWTAAGILAVAACIHRCCTSRSRVQRTWLLFTLGCGSWLAGQMFWDYYSLFSGFPLSPTPADAGYLMFAPLFAAGILSMVEGNRLGRTLLAIDCVMLALSLSVVVVTGFRVHIEQSGLPAAAQATALLYPIAYGTLTCLIVLLPARETWRHGGMSLLFLGMLGQALPFALWTPLLLAGDPLSRTSLDQLWIFGMLCVAGSAVTTRAFPHLDSETQVYGARVALPLALAAAAGVVRSWALQHAGITLPVQHVLTGLMAALLIVTAARLALTLRRSRQLVNEIRAAHSEAETAARALSEKAQRLETLTQISRVVSGTLDLHTLYDTIYDQIAGVMDASQFFIALVDRDRGILRVPYSREDGSLVVDEEFPYGDNTTSVIIQEGRPLLYLTEEEYKEHERKHRLTPYFVGHQDSESGIFVPLNTGHRTIGALSVQSSRPRSYSPDDVATLSVIASQAAVAIENAGLFAAQRAQVLELQQLKDALAHQAYHDALTDLPNRALFRTRLHDAIQAAQPAREPFVVLLLDLDGFKEVNDGMGHHYGDLLLQRLASRLRARVQPEDTVARLGGDEFAIILRGMSAEGAEEAARDIAAAAEEPCSLEGRVVRVRTSIGAVACPSHAADVDDLLRRADVAMYAAKRTRTGTSVYAKGLDEAAEMRSALARDAHQAFKRHDFVLEYQPKVQAGSGRAAAVEALTRWDHPARGRLMPDDYLPVLDEMGLMPALTEYVLDRALRDCARWRRAGHRLRVAVNLSSADLDLPNFADTVLDMICRWGVPAAWLELEITERSIVRDPVQALRTLSVLHRAGVCICVDDFGTGYSSLAHLRQLPIDEVKIDKSFVSESVRDIRNAEIVRCVVDLGHGLGLRVVAEGVEDRETLALLEGMGCDLIQGSYLGRPMPVESLPSWVRESPVMARRRSGTSARSAEAVRRGVG